LTHDAQWPAPLESDYFGLWRKSGLPERLHTTLREKTRIKVGHNPYPTAKSADSQSVKTGEKGG